MTISKNIAHLTAMDITTIIVTAINIVFGTSGLAFFLLNKKIKKMEMVSIMQKVYEQFVRDTSHEMEQMKIEISMLRQTIEGQYNNCIDVRCKNHRIKEFIDKSDS